MTKKTQKKLRKALLLISCAALLVCITVGVTVAYLTSTAEVKNTFSVGKVIIDMDEANTDKKDGEPDRDKVNAYTSIKPSDVLDKDPIVWVDNNSEDSYVFIEVTNGLLGLEADVEGKDTINEQILADNKWTTLSTSEDGKTIVYYKAVDVSELIGTTAATKAGFKGIDTFKKVYISSAASNENDATLKINDYDNAEITIKAYAIQQAGFTGDTAVTDAWNAVKTAYDGE